MFASITGEDVFGGQEICVGAAGVLSHSFPVSGSILPHSESVYWNGLYLDASNYRLSANQLIIDAAVHLKASDVIYIKFMLGE